MKKNNVLLCALLLVLFASLSANIDNPFMPIATHMGSGLAMHSYVTVDNLPARQGDRLITFVGDDVRGNNPLFPLGGGNVGVSAGSLIQTILSGETLEFYLWRQLEQIVLTTTYTYIVNLQTQTIGSSNNPITINFTGSSLTVSGRIVREENLTQPVPGVNIYFDSIVPLYNGSLFSSLTTNNDGYYAIPNLPVGTNMLYMPHSLEHEFNPPNKSIDYLSQSVTQNFIATSLPTVTVSGHIRYGNTPVSGVIIGPTTTDQNGFYSFPVAQNSGVTLTPSKPGWTFTPPSYTISFISQNEVRDFQATPNYITVSGTLDVSDFYIHIQSNLSGDSSLYFPTNSFSVTNILPGDTITFTPEKEGYLFLPQSRTLSNIMANQTIQFSSQILTYDVSGTITYEGNPMVGVEIFSGQTVIATTNSQGEYSFTTEHGSTHTITPQSPGFIFDPSSLTFSNITADITAGDFLGMEIPLFQLTFTVMANQTTPVSEVNIFWQIVSGGSGMITTNDNGVATIGLDGTPNHVTFTPSKLGHTFIPDQIVLQGINESTVKNWTIAAIVPSYTVSGYVSLNGTGLPGVDINITGLMVSPVITNAMGNYLIPDVPYGSNITITPTMAGFTFSPNNIPLSNITSSLTGQNFTAQGQPAPVTVITREFNNAPIQNITVSYSSQQSNHSGQGNTLSNGEYTFMGNRGESYIITLSNLGAHLFDPISKTTPFIIGPTTIEFTSVEVETISLNFTILSQGNPLAGVNISYQIENGGSGSATTGANGVAIISLVETTNQVTFTPFMVGYDFDPTHITLNGINNSTNTNQGFTAIIHTFDISGIVTMDTFGLSSVLIQTLGYTPVTQIMTAPNGSYTIPDVPFGTSLTISPSRPGFSFTPENITVSSISADIFSQNFAASSIPVPVTIVTRDMHNQFISGIVVNYSSNQNNHSGSGYTINGVYIFDAIYGDTYTISVTSTQEHYFSEPSVITNILTTPATFNFQTSQRKFIPIVFTVFDDNSPFPDAEIFYQIQNGASGSITTDIDGIAMISLEETNDTVTFIPVKSGYFFEPPSVVFNGLHSLDDPPNPIYRRFDTTVETFSISGYVLLHTDEVALPNVQIHRTDIQTNPVFTDADGFYIISGIQHGSNVTLYPERDGFTFHPIERHFNYVTQNFIYEIFVALRDIIPITIRTIDYNNNPISGIQINFMSAPDNHTGIGITNPLGEFYLNAWQAENYTISISNVGDHLFIESLISTGPINHSQIFTFQTRERESFNLSFQVFHQGNPLPEIPIFYQIENGMSGEIITDIQGIASIILEETDKTIFFEPSKPGHTFNPPNVSLYGLDSNTPLNYILNAFIQTFNITGSVFYEGVGFHAVNITTPGFDTAPVFTAPNGDYIVQNIPYGTSLSLLPVREGFTFTPQSITINNISNNHSNQNFIADIETLQVLAHIKDYNDAPIAGVNVTYVSTSSGHTGFGNTNSSGNFSFQANYDENYTVSIANFHPHIFDVTEQLVLNVILPQTVTFQSREPEIYILSGTIINSETNEPMENVLVQINTDEVYTNALGMYSQSIFEGSSLTITPFFIGYNFTPTSIEIDYVDGDYLNQDFSAEHITYFVRGEVLKNSQPFQGVIIQNFGNTVDMTNALGRFEFIVYHGDGLHITLIHDDHTFDPPNHIEDSVISPVNFLVFIATPIQYTVSGYALNNNIPIPDVRVFDTLSDKEVITGIDGHFSLEFDIHSTLNIQAEKPYYNFPESINIQGINSHVTQNLHGRAICAEVTFSIPPGTYSQPISIALSTITEDAQIYYTVDNSTPTQSSFIYTQPIQVSFNSSVYIKARAFRDPTHDPSPISEGLFIVTGTLNQPTFSHQTGHYFEALNVVISADPETTIHYTTNGSTPTIYSPIYTDPVFINKNTILRAIAARENFNPSPDSSALYEISHNITLSLPAVLNLLPNQSYTLNVLNHIVDSVAGEHTYLVYYLNEPVNLHLTVNGHLLTILPFENWTGVEEIDIVVRYEPEPISSIRSDLLSRKNSSVAEISDFIRRERMYAFRPVSEISDFITPVEVIQNRNRNNGIQFQSTPNIATGTMRIEVFSNVHPPYIENWYPDYPENQPYGEVVYPLLSTIEFFVNLLDQEDISYEWFVNDVPQFHNNGIFRYTFNVYNPKIRVEVSRDIYTLNREWHVTTTVSDNDENSIGYTDKLIGNFPNPFNPETTIIFTLAEEDDVEIAVYNLRGQFIELLTNNRFPRGQNHVTWNAAEQSSGIYLISFRTVNHYELRRIVLLK
ncbi:MAG: chitobiase/beta-hexosaminidase C-terminal domain-containing protein [Candidatus Cloacimonetes bacterium]|nr:chitobiase/beta-hexosaminidase C-terminal domain-containing protein [Candidatus Cloacimonadota bacterium]